MADYAEDVNSGKSAFESWIQKRFPDAESYYTGTRNDDFHRWTIDFGPGDPALRLGATERVLEDDTILAERLADLERGSWLDDVTDQPKWILLMAVGVVAKSREDW